MSASTPPSLERAPAEERPRGGSAAGSLGLAACTALVVGNEWQFGLGLSALGAARISAILALGG